VRPQRDAFELPSAVRLLDLHVSAKVEVPELMTGGKWARAR
jgi:hypothetical protein